ncbi:hypothetical protein RJ639_018713 [Escallonia herrerae]|uniref:Transposase MuDR plant domain-containing protein n=1 Tax=Escallonia herrerae TaxID=1293975 RepID=A0AA88V9Y5_9ASTE|nr:hypothetical protein RJ639_018713 [Escallonia herrerae]
MDDVLLYMRGPEDDPPVYGTFDYVKRPLYAQHFRFDDMDQALGYEGFLGYYLKEPLGETYMHIAVDDCILYMVESLPRSRVVDIYTTHPNGVKHINKGVDNDLGSNTIEVLSVHYASGVRDVGGDDVSEDNEIVSAPDYEGDSTSDEDDVMFDKNMDDDSEWAGVDKDVGKMVEGQSTSTDYADTKEIKYNFVHSDGEVDIAAMYPEYNKRTDYEQPFFVVGMMFSSIKELKDAIYSHAAKWEKVLKMIKNERYRIRAKCAAEGCEWMIYGSYMHSEHTVQIETLGPEYTCGKKDKNWIINSTWLAQRYIDDFRRTCAKRKKAEGQGSQGSVLNDGGVSTGNTVRATQEPKQGSESARQINERARQENTGTRQGRVKLSIRRAGKGTKRGGAQQNETARPKRMSSSQPLPMRSDNHSGPIYGMFRATPQPPPAMVNIGNIKVRPASYMINGRNVVIASSLRAGINARQSASGVSARTRASDKSRD